jgi:hypothetical protein
MSPRARRPGNPARGDSPPQPSPSQHETHHRHRTHPAVWLAVGAVRLALVWVKLQRGRQEVTPAGAGRQDEE